MSSPRKVEVRLCATAKATMPTEMAPAITNASDGSQEPAMSRNCRTLEGLAMPETMSPSPNTSPASSEVNTFIAGPQKPIRCRSTNTVTKPAPMNAAVATSERGDRRERPQTPWPLVQPEP